ncbi:MAG: hypothetical protein QW814_02215, partial [Methanothrix sp.]
RIGEACQLHISNIDFDKRELRLFTEKARKMDSLLIPIELFKETVEYVTKNADFIKSANGYIFFKENDNNHNDVQHVDPSYTRKVFRETLKAVGLGYPYCDYEET